MPSGRYRSAIEAKIFPMPADAKTAPNSLTYGILAQFGPNNLPQEGKKMAVFSTGTARAPGDAGYVNPNGQVSSYDAKTIRWRFECDSSPGYDFSKNVRLE